MDFSSERCFSQVTEIAKKLNKNWLVFDRESHTRLNIALQINDLVW